SEVGITPAASFAAVTDASTIFKVVTELSASFDVIIAPAVTVGFGYVPDKSPPAGPLGTPPLSVAGDHCVPLYFKTCPLVAPVVLTITPWILVTPGLGYEPDRSPPAVPLGGNEVGITPAASFADVTDASTIFAVVTELSASFNVVIAPAVTAGFGYVPDKSPPAGPLKLAAFSAPGCHCVPLNFKTCPFAGTAFVTPIPCILLTKGLG